MAMAHGNLYYQGLALGTWQFPVLYNFSRRGESIHGSRNRVVAAELRYSCTACVREARRDQY